MLAEVFLGSFIWRLTTTLNIDVMAYMDDLNLIADTPHVLEAAPHQLWHFADIFELGISMDKTYLWGTHDPRLAEIGARWGLAIKESVVCFGTEWPLKPGMTLSHTKDAKRIDSMLKRLQRLTTITMKAGVISVGCLTLMDYSVIPVASSIAKVRAAVRRALGLQAGSPEIVFNLLGKVTLESRPKA